MFERMEKEEKLELLGKLHYHIDEKNFRPFRDLGPDDSIEDIRYEVFRAQRDASKKRNIKYMQKGLVTVANGIELLNNFYKPMGMSLEGYSKSVLLSIHEYDEIFEELHWKWCDSFSVPAEAKLLMTLVSSVWFFHMSNATTNSGSRRSSVRRGDESADDEDDEEEARLPSQQPRMTGPRRPTPGFSVGSGGMNAANIMSGIGMLQTILRS